MGLIYGKNAVKEAIMSGKTINKIYYQKENKEIGSIVKLALDSKIVTVASNKINMDKMVTKEGEKLVNSQGIVANVTDYVYYDVQDILEEAKTKGEDPFVIVLDKIEDPHNLGAIVRTIECLGAHGCIIQKRNACQVTDVVEKVAVGATSYVKIARVTNITETINYLKKQGLWVYGLDMDGKDIHKTDLTGGVCLVIGNEGKGISRLVKESCDDIIKIPMFGKINSLNASNAAAIAMYEVTRQKSVKK